MGAFTSVTVIGRSSTSEGFKRVLVTAVGPASYDAGGSAIDLSAATLGADAGFTTVKGGHCVMAAHGSTKIKLDAHVVAGASATAPLISAGVMIANLPWNITKTSSGMCLSP